MAPKDSKLPLATMAMAQSNASRFIAAILMLCAFAPCLAGAAELPADPCSLLPASELTKTLGATYAPPEKSIAPSPFPRAAAGTDCRYQQSKDATEGVMFRTYADPSPSAAAEMFAKLNTFFGPPTPIQGVGDEAYFDKYHGIHVRKGKVRFYIAIGHYTPNLEKPIKNLASQVAAQL